MSNNQRKERVINQPQHRKNRSDHVMQIILKGFFLISVLCFLINAISKIVLGDQYRGAPIWVTGSATILVLVAIKASMVGYAKIINYLFSLFVLFVTVNIVLSSGFENFFALLMMVFYIILVSILFGRNKEFFALITLMFAVFLMLTYLQVNNIVHPNVGWKLEAARFSTGLSIVVFLSVITLISWLFNQEISNYIFQLEKSELLLQKERDLLETRVEEKTKQLQEEQAEKIAQFSKFAEFGRLSQGLFHDLANPLTALSLNLNQIKRADNADLSELQTYINGAASASENIEKLFKATRDYLQNRKEKSSFSIVDELKNTQQICNYRAKKAGVNLAFQEENDVPVFGNKTRFSQLINNLVINAIEAFEFSSKNSESTNGKQISINFHEAADLFILKVKDNASGIPEKIAKDIFKPFYTTKEQKGNTGIGLSMCRDIVETDFMGTIDVKSELGKGTEFIISLPKTVVSH